MTTKVVAGHEFKLPYRGRLGANIESTLRSIIYAAQRGESIALYAAMGLRGSAKNYADKYERAFDRFAAANADVLEYGKTGPKGGRGYRFVGGR